MRISVKKYMGSYADRAVALSAFSSVVNFISASGKLAYGVHLRSFWYTVNAVYYILLSAVRVIAVVTYKRMKSADNADGRIKTENKYYNSTGVFIFLLSSVYFLICTYMLGREYAVVAQDYGVYAVVYFTVYKIAFSAYGIFISRKTKNKIVETLKTVSLTDALTSSVVSLCTVLNFINKTAAVKISAVFGMLLSSAFMAVGLIMTIRRNDIHPEPEEEP